MQWLAEICVRRPVFAVMLVAALVVAGIIAYTQMGVARYPNIDMPALFIYTRHPGASPSEIESEISQPLEDAVATVEGVDELRSISFEGASIVILNLDLNRNVDLAAQDARDAIGRDIDELPFGTEPPQIGKRDLDSSPVMTIAISGPRDGRELYVLADRYVKQVIESAEGVGEVTIRGAMDRAVQVRIDARRLAAYGLSIVEVREALARQNTEIPGGLMQTPTQEFTLRTMGRVDKARDFNDLVVATIDGHPIRLSDLGEAIDGQKELRNKARLNDVPAVVLFVQRQSGANTVDVIQEVKTRLERSRELLPPDVSVSVLQDQSGYIVAAMHEVQKHLISGSVLASLVVLLFMRSWQSALIAAIAIPTSIIATFAIMRPLGFTLNNVTMLALVLMVGVVIDDAVIVLENVFRYIEEEGLNPFEAAIRGTREIGLAVLATTFSLVIVFLPVSFLDSVTGRLLFQFGITATIAVLISMLISFSLTPMMCSRLLRQRHSDSPIPQSRSGIYQYIESGYLICLRWAMQHRWLVACISLITIAANYPLYHLVKQDYIPSNVDESEFEIRLTADEGTGMQSMDKATLAIENQLKNIDGIEYMLTSVGGRGAVNRSEIFIRLVDISNRSFSIPRLVRDTLRGNPRAAWEGNFSQQEKMQEVRDILNQFPDLRGSVRNLTSFRQGPPVDIDFSITGPSLDGLHDYGNRLLTEAKTIPGIVDADLTLKMNKPELLVHINRERAAALGVDVQEIAETLRICVGGDEHVSRYRDDLADDAYDVELRLVGIDRSNTDAISQLYVRTKNSTTQQNTIQQAGSQHTRLDNVVNFEYGEAASRIDRLDHERMVAIRANIAPGFALKDRIEALNEAVERVNLPEGYNTSVRGRGRELERTLNEFGWTFLMSFIFMYIVLAAQFEHFIHPITILISLPLAVPFGLFSLWMGGETLNLYSALGILVLFGVVKKASILQVDHTNQLREQGMPRDAAIMLANRDRLRPILMTTFSFVAGMFPLLIGVGPGAEERRSIAVLAVGGQTLSLLLTLLAIPVTYSLLDDLWAGRFKQQSDE
ncbi:MAG: efflux RND transporter permease subunit [Pirellulaceae bacterium]|nr:efflux RND transporter permease subunit [Pirellulaceae bacterium]